MYHENCYNDMVLSGQIAGRYNQYLWEYILAAGQTNGCTHNLIAHYSN